MKDIKVGSIVERTCDNNFLDLKKGDVGVVREVFYTSIVSEYCAIVKFFKGPKSSVPFSSLKEVKVEVKNDE